MPQQPLLSQVAELIEIHDVPGVRIDLALHGQLELVVVTMEVGVTALAEGGPIPRLRELRIIQAVGGVEVHSTGDSAAGHNSNRQSSVGDARSRMASESFRCGNMR